jgi:hypothetical protein
MRKRSTAWLIGLGAGIVLLGILLFRLGEKPGLPQYPGQPLPVMHKGDVPKPYPQGWLTNQADGRTPRPTHATQPFRVTLTDSRGKILSYDINSAEAPGFIETVKNEHYRIKLVWPHGDKEIWATRMDGGAFEGDRGMLLKLPVNERGEVDFGFRIGPEAGRYQIEFAGAGGGVEHLAFWADSPNLPVESSGTTFVEPPLRKTPKKKSSNQG